jgi:hypothetical protein
MPRVIVVPAPGGGQPVVARADTQGAVHLLCNSTHGPWYAKSTDNGRTFGPAIQVVTQGSAKPGLRFYGTDMAVGRGGRIHVAAYTNAWQLKLPQEEWAFFYARLEPVARAFSPVQNLNHKPSEGYSLAADDKGNVTACWLSGKLYANVSHDDGKTFSATAEIDPAYDPCNCRTTSAVYGADGKLAVLYREETNNERDMYLVLWDQERGHASRTRISSTLWKIDACPMTYHTIARDRDGFVAAWPTKGQVYFSRLDGKGNPVTPGEVKTPGQAGMRSGVLALLGAPDRSTLVAWKKDGRMSWQVYDSEGRPSGPGGAVHSSGDGVAGVVDKDGRFTLLR